jgi:hypothetical protein
VLKALDIASHPNISQAQPMLTMKTILLWTLALAMIAIGVSHFLNPDPFMRIVPPPLPEREFSWTLQTHSPLGVLGFACPFRFSLSVGLGGSPAFLGHKKTHQVANSAAFYHPRRATGLREDPSGPHRD